MRLYLHIILLDNKYNIYIVVIIAIKILDRKHYKNDCQSFLILCDGLINKMSIIIRNHFVTHFFRKHKIIIYPVL